MKSVKIQSYIAVTFYLDKFSKNAYKPIFPRSGMREAGRRGWPPNANSWIHSLTWVEVFM